MTEENQINPMSNNGFQDEPEQINTPHQPEEAKGLETEIPITPEKPEITPEPTKSVMEATTQAPVSMTTNKLDSDTILFAAMSYLSALFIVPLVAKKGNKFVTFHAKEGTALFVAEVIIWFVLWLLEAFLEGVFSYHAIGFTQFLYKLAWVAFGAASVLGIYNVITGKEKHLPYLSIVTKNLKL